MNLDGFEKKNPFPLILKAFNLSTVDFLYLAMRVLLGPRWTG